MSNAVFLGNNLLIYFSGDIMVSTMCRLQL